MKIIAKINTDFPSKFGVPRQSGLVDDLTGEIVFEPEFRRKEALIGIEEFSHIWVIWSFSESKRSDWSATVCPPRLGGKEKRGVFATRSPFRPNSIGLSCVKLEKVQWEGKDGPKLIISGIDMMDGTPVYDIKPYIPYADSRPEAAGGFGELHKDDGIEVDFPEDLLDILPVHKRAAALDVLKQDPRAAYNKQPDFIYGMGFAGYDIRFTVTRGVLTVCQVIPTDGIEWNKVK